MSRLLLSVASFPILVVVLAAALPAICFPQPIQQAATLNKNHPTETAETLLAHLATHPDDAGALTTLARIRLDEGDTSAATQLLIHALGSSPNSPVANITLGEILLRQHRYPEAMDRFETVLAT